MFSVSALNRPRKGKKQRDFHHLLVPGNNNLYSSDGLLRRRTRHGTATGGRHSRAGTRRRPPPVLRPSWRRRRRSLQLVQIDKIKIDSGYFTHAQISASNSRTRAPPLRRRPPPHGPPLGVPPQIHLPQVQRRPSPPARQRPRPIPCVGLGRPLAASRRPSMARPQVRRSGRAPPQPLPAPSRWWRRSLQRHLGRWRSAKHPPCCARHLQRLTAVRFCLPIQ